MTIQLEKLIIAIDGYSSCGKSTLAKSLAEKLNYIYVDTGAMYRAVTLFFLDQNIDIQNVKEVDAALEKIKIEFKRVSNSNQTFLNGKNVESEIRQMFVSDWVSAVSEISQVRKFLVRQQKEMGKNKGIVMDGRDIGTVVFPDADIKIFMTASMQIRAKRRFDEMQAKGIHIKFEELIENLSKRDFIDSNRKDSPLKKAEESIEIDNSHLTEQEQLDMVLHMVEKLKV